MNADEIFAKARNDPELLGTLNVEELLATLREDDRTDYLENETLASLCDKVVGSIVDLGVYSTDTVGRMAQSLLEYRFVDKISDLHAGKAIKWLKISPPETDDTKAKMKSGAICGGVRFRDDGAYILCVSINGKNFFQLKYDDHLIYQKLSNDELLILTLYDYLDKHE